MHPSGSTHQLDHILINNKWKNSLRNCRAYNSVELDSDHRIFSIRLVCSLRTSRAKPCKRPKFNWKKLQDAATKEQFQLELSNRFDVLRCNNMSTPITERSESFENAVEEVAEKVVGRCSPCGMPSWVSDRTKQLKTERYVAKRKYLLSKSKRSREIWGRLSSGLGESYGADGMAGPNRRVEELQLADSGGDCSTAWRMIHDLSGGDRDPRFKVKVRDGAPPGGDGDLLVGWQACFGSLLNSDGGRAPSGLPQPAARGLPVRDRPPTLGETLGAIRRVGTDRAAGLDCTITAEALQGGGDAMADVVHCFCAEVCSSLAPPGRWIAGVIVPLPERGDLSLVTNCRGISLLSMAAEVCDEVLLDRIRDEVDPILGRSRAGFRPGRGCAQQIHILGRVLEGFGDCRLPLVVTFVDFRGAFGSISGRVMFAVLRHCGIPDAVVGAVSVLYKNSGGAAVVDGGLSGPFGVTAGVLQGDVLAPFLFVVLVDYLLKKATSRLGSGVVAHPRRSGRHPALSLGDLDFADDVALLESSVSRAQARLTRTAEAAADLGLVTSAPGTECVTVGCNPWPALRVCGGPVSHVSDFGYLGSMVASGSGDLRGRESLAWCAFWRLGRLWRSPHVSIAAKVELFDTTCVTVLLCGCESWVVSRDVENGIGAFAASCCGVVLGVGRIGRVLDATVCSMTDAVPLIHLVRHRQLKFLGHILRMSKEEPARRYALYIPTIGKRKPGRPRTSYLNYVQRLLGDNEGTMQELQIAAFADDRCAWRNLVVACSAADG